MTILLAAFAALSVPHPLPAAVRGLDTPFPRLGAAVNATYSTEQHSALLEGGVPQTGEVVITEFMKDPASVTDAKGEWIEVYNTLPWRVNLEGWQLLDDSGSHHTINVGGAGLRMRRNSYLVLGINSDPAQNGGVQVDYQYSSFTLSNTTDQIVLARADGTVVDRVAYDNVSWPTTAGKAISLKMSARTAVLNDDPTNWCMASTALSASNPDTGTPRHDNDACP